MLLTLGKERWKTELMAVHLQLSQSNSIYVRRSLAFSLHHIAKVIGPEEAEIHLLKIFGKYIKAKESVHLRIWKAL